VIKENALHIARHFWGQILEELMRMTFIIHWHLTIHHFLMLFHHVAMPIRMAKLMIRMTTHLMSVSAA